MPKEGVDRQLYLSTKLEGKKGPLVYIVKLKMPVSLQIYCLTLIKLTSCLTHSIPTMLLEYSKEEGIQNKISEELFEAFFIHGKNMVNSLN